MEKNWRLIISKKSSGYYNMALDEAILLDYAQRKVPTLRIYGWEEPFLTLGYNQDQREVLSQAEAISFTRRITGGSAILHDQEITYSLVCSMRDLSFFGGVKDSYGKLCLFIKNFYKKLNIKADFAKDVYSQGLGEYKNFCFSSFLPFDLLIENKKIGGNAQRRKRNIIFQHGSIPQKLNRYLISELIKDTKDLDRKTTSLNEVLGCDTSFSKLSKALADSFRDTFCVDFIYQDLFDSERKLAIYLMENKYSQKSWNIYREKIYNEWNPKKTTLV